MSKANEMTSQATSGSEVERIVMGPPTPGPIVNIQAPGLFLHLQVNDELDLQILQMVVERAEHRRYAKAP